MSDTALTLVVVMVLLALANVGSAQDRPLEAPQGAEGASEPETGATPGEGEIAALRAGQRAPWAGLLIVQEDLVRWRLEIERLRFRLRVDVEALTARHGVELQLMEGRVTAERERTDLHDTLWQDRANGLAAELAAERVTEWYEHPTLWYVLGAVTVVVVVVAVAGL